MEINTLKQSFINPAKKLFHQFGIKNVSAEEIAKEANSNIKLFYKAYRNKEEVALEVLKEENEIAIKEYKSIMNQNIPFTAKMRTLLETNKMTVQNKSEEFLKDTYDNEIEGLKDFVQNSRIKLNNLFIKDLTIAQKEGWIRPDLKIEFVLYLISFFQEKISNKGIFYSLFGTMSEMNTQLVDFLFHGILNPEMECQRVEVINLQSGV